MSEFFIHYKDNYDGHGVTQRFPTLADALKWMEEYIESYGGRLSDFTLVEGNQIHPKLTAEGVDSGNE